MKSKIKILLLFWVMSVVVSLFCVNENNQTVDWFVVYKLPIIKHHEDLVKEGVAYIYMTSEDYGTWKFSNVSINSSESIIGKTLQWFYNNNENMTYILYNDQPPNKKSKSNKGHNKGVVLADDVGGLWLIHSVPHFPQFGLSYSYPKTGTTYGQSFLCISMDLVNLNKVGIQLQYNEPEIYGENIFSNLKTSLPDLAKAAANITNDIAPWYHVLNITSVNNTEFISFAKSQHFNKELYEDLVAPFLQSDLLVETWPNGPGRLESNCSKQFKVNNIQSIVITTANVSFTTTRDHSKWAVSAELQANQWICIGDINREEHQKFRGGGTVCMSNTQLSSDYKNIIQSIENCPIVYH